MQEQQELHHNPRIAMGKATKILRRSIHTFLQNYQHFTTTIALIAFPFSLSLLISQAITSSLFPTIHNRLQTLFDALSFPPSSQLFKLLTHKLSQTISSSILTLPFTLSFLLVAKASIFQTLNSKNNKNPSFSSALSIYPSLLTTYLFNSILIISANATVFSLFFIAFTFPEEFGFSYSPKALLFISACGAVLYSIVLANALIICHVALVLSGEETRGEYYLRILKACLVIRGRSSTGLVLALPVSLGLAGIEALFQYRVVKGCFFEGKKGSLMVLEGIFIAYLYSILVVFDTVVSFMFFKSCKMSSLVEYNDEESEGCKNLKAALKAALKEVS